jgi:hypothetical protein
MTQIANLCRSFSQLVVEEPIRAIEQPIKLARHDEVVLMQSFDRLGAQRDSSITSEADVGVMAFCLSKLTNFLNKAPRFPEIVESNGPLDAVGRPPSAIVPGCVKTCTSSECAELFSLFSSFDGDCQSGSFVIQRNRDKTSTRKFDVGVFTQPGSFAGAPGSTAAAS